MKIISPYNGHDILNYECDEDHIVYAGDEFPDSKLNSVLTNKKLKYIVSDSYTLRNTTCDIFYGIPGFIAWQATKQFLTDPSPDTSHIFNFMINKKKSGRFLCIKLIEYFKLTDYKYTFSGCWNTIDSTLLEQELQSLSTALNLENVHTLFDKVTIPKFFLSFEGDTTIENSQVNYAIGNDQTWNRGLHGIFNNTAISLITETDPDVPVQGTLYSEKTLYATLGLTFPIWVGGYKHASEWHRLGFDIFDDVVDHSYQNYNTLFERCYYAIADNLEILTNKSKITQLRKENLPRLLKNRELLQNGHLDQVIKQQVSTWPADLQAHLPGIFSKHFTGYFSNYF